MSASAAVPGTDAVPKPHSASHQGLNMLCKAVIQVDEFCGGAGAAELSVGVRTRSYYALQDANVDAETLARSTISKRFREDRSLRTSTEPEMPTAAANVPATRDAVKRVLRSGSDAVPYRAKINQAPPLRTLRFVPYVPPDTFRTTSAKSARPHAKKKKPTLSKAVDAKGAFEEHHPAIMPAESAHLKTQKLPEGKGSDSPTPPAPAAPAKVGVVCGAPAAEVGFEDAATLPLCTMLAQYGPSPDDMAPLPPPLQMLPMWGNMFHVSAFRSLRLSLGKLMSLSPSASAPPPPPLWLTSSYLHVAEPIVSMHFLASLATRAQRRALGQPESNPVVRRQCDIDYQCARVISFAWDPVHPIIYLCICFSAATLHNALRSPTMQGPWQIVALGLTYQSCASGSSNVLWVHTVVGEHTLSWGAVSLCAMEFPEPSVGTLPLPAHGLASSRSHQPVLLVHLPGQTYASDPAGVRTPVGFALTRRNGVCVSPTVSLAPRPPGTGPEGSSEPIEAVDARVRACRGAFLQPLALHAMETGSHRHDSRVASEGPTLGFPPMLASFFACSWIRETNLLRMSMVVSASVQVDLFYRTDILPMPLLPVAGVVARHGGILSAAELAMAHHVVTCLLGPCAQMNVSAPTNVV